MRTFVLRTLFRSLVVAGSLTLLGGVVAGCDTDRGRRTVDTTPEFSINSSAREIMVGETVTITTQSRNLMGRDVDVEWTSTGGDLSTERNGQIARVKFDKPGTYTVAATATFDNRVMTDSVTVNVRPLR